MQVAAVGAFLAAVFAVPALAVVFVMVTARCRGADRLGPARAAAARAAELVVVPALIAAELVAAFLLSRVVARAVTATGERVRTRTELLAQSADRGRWRVPR